jgi:putative oxidoreductase
MITTTQLEYWRPRVRSLLRIAAALPFFEVGTMKLLHFPQPLFQDELPLLILIAGYLELIGGFLLVIGLFVRPVAFILSGEMAFAFFIGHVAPHGTIDPGQNEGTLAILYCFIFLYLVFAGGGAWSLDAWLRKR